MLTYESLMEQAKIRSMPPTKARGILREYLQILIMKELCRTEAGKKLYFTGGTYLRLVHGLKRFSEDLDFNASRITRNEFETLVNKIGKELQRIDIKSHAEFSHRGKIYAGKLIFREIEKAYNITSKYSRGKGIMIKIETNRPAWKIKTETQVISSFGEFFPCVCTDKGAFFADKIDALNKKERGRHIYDIVFMLSNKYPINGNVLKVLGIKKDPMDVISDRIKVFSKTDLKKQAEALRPFLFDESEADMVARIQDMMPLLLEKYKKENK